MVKKSNRITSEEYHAVAARRGFRWVGETTPANTKTHTSWECSLGHRWTTTYNLISHGRGCPHCSHTARKTPAEYHAAARQRGFLWLGPEVGSTTTKTGWQCPAGHHWEASFVAIRWKGSGCPYCSGNARLTKEDYQRLAAKTGFAWVAQALPKNNRSPTTWRCPHGHTWQTAYNTIQEGAGCPHCAGNAQKTALDYRAIAAARGITWAGDVLPANASTKTEWACREGHRWSAVYSDVASGHGCPVCAAKHPKAEDYQEAFRWRGIRWVGETVPEHGKVCTEWECQQGHRFTATWTRMRQGKVCPHCARVHRGGRRLREEEYHALAKARGIEWFGEQLPKNGTTKTLWRCAKGHIWKADYDSIRSERHCPFCAQKVPKQERDYHQLAETRELYWIGESLPKNTKERTLWRCKHGHEWRAHYNLISQGAGCPHCAAQVPKTAEDYNALALVRGIQWIGNELPKNTREKTTWQCQKGHQWAAAYFAIQSGKGCPHCAGVAPKQASDYHILAGKVGCQWVGVGLPANAAQKTEWLCQQGHVMRKSYNAMLKRPVCQECKAAMKRRNEAG